MKELLDEYGVWACEAPMWIPIPRQRPKPAIGGALPGRCMAGPRKVVRAARNRSLQNVP